MSNPRKAAAYADLDAIIEATLTLSEGADRPAVAVAIAIFGFGFRAVTHALLDVADAIREGHTS